MPSSKLNEIYSTEPLAYVIPKRAAVELLNSIDKLLFDKTIELVSFRNNLVDTSISEVVRLPRYFAEVVKLSH